MPVFPLPSQRIHFAAHLSMAGDRSQCDMAHWRTPGRWLWASTRAPLAGHRWVTASGSSVSTTRPTAKPSFRERLCFRHLGSRAAPCAPPTNPGRATPNIEAAAKVGGRPFAAPPPLQSYRFYLSGLCLVGAHRRRSKMRCSRARHSRGTCAPTPSHSLQHSPSPGEYTHLAKPRPLGGQAPGRRG
jgi:hypothetical protein